MSLRSLVKSHACLVSLVYLHWPLRLRSVCHDLGRVGVVLGCWGEAGTSSGLDKHCTTELQPQPCCFSFLSSHEKFGFLNLNNII